MMKKQTLISLILLIIVSIYFAKDTLLELIQNNTDTSSQTSLSSSSSSIDAQGLPSRADYFFQQVNIKQFSPQGQRQNLISADKIEHFKQTQHSEISAISLTLTNDNQHLWQLKANNGRLDHKTNQVFLADKVKIEQINTNDPIKPEATNKAHLNSNIEGSNFELNTANLLLDLDKQTATTRAPISLINRADSINNNSATRQGQTTSKALGMQADFKIEQFKLLNDPQTQGVIYSDE